MKQITIDLERSLVRVPSESGAPREIPLATAEAFALVSRAWLRAGWDTKHVYSFTWLGRPIIQLPEDMVRIQEVIYALKPDVIIETGVAHGGSLIFYASLCKAMDRGRVIGVDIEIRPHNRAAIEAHPLFDRITLIEGNSVDPAIVERVRNAASPGARVMVNLDSCHTKAHVLAELEAYAPLVTPGSYIVAMDGIMAHVVGAPRTQPDWTWNNPKEAVREFLASHPEFVQEDPLFLFNEGLVTDRVTYWPSAFLKRV
jgi:cephalosporin hydroxylase